MQAGGKADRLAALAAALVAVAIVLAIFGPGIANPADTGWLQGDAITTQFGWHQYRHDPAHWYPVETNRGSWPMAMPTAIYGTMPVFDVLLKPLAPLLPDRVQYLGPAFVAGIALQALLAWAVFREALPQARGRAHRWVLFLAAVLFATAPVLLVRFYYTHLPLALHWPVLLALLAYLRSFRVSFWQTVGLFALTTFVASGINPYSMVMAVLVYGGFIVKSLIERQLAWPKYVFMVIPLMSGFASLVLFGLIEPGSEGALGGDGFGLYSANALALVDPVYEYFSSALIPDPKVMGPGQYEGFGYLGAGAILLLLAGLATALATRSTPAPDAPRILRPLIAVVLVSWLLALSNVIALGTYVVEVPLPDALLGLLQNFRSSGRFIAVVIYVLMFAAVVMLVRRLPPPRAALVMAAVALLQIVDLAGPYAEVGRRFDQRHLTRGIVERFADPAYRNLGAAHDRLLILPPWQCLPGGDAATDYPRNWFIRFANLAMDNGLATNSFYGGRTPVAQALYHCRAMPDALAAHPADRRTAYLLSAPAFARHGAHIAASHRCDYAEAMFLCRADGGAPGLTARARAALAPAAGTKETGT